MSDEAIPGPVPVKGGGASSQPQSPGATASQLNDAVTSPALVPDCGASKQPQSPGATEDQATGHRAERAANFGALLSALIASSGCWLPPLLILGGISGAGISTLMEDYRTAFIVVTFGFLAVAFYLTYRPRSANDATAPASKIMSFNKVMLWAVTVVVVVFLFYPQMTSNLFATGDEITQEMERTVIRIEGMTGLTGVPKAKEAIKSAPGVLAVNVNFEKRQATIGTEKGKSVPITEILSELDSIGYQGEVVDPVNRTR